MISTKRAVSHSRSLSHLETTLYAMRWMAKMLGRNDLVRLTNSHLCLTKIEASKHDLERLQNTLSAQKIIARLTDRDDAAVALDADLVFIAKVIKKKAPASKQSVVISGCSSNRLWHGAAPNPN